MNRFFIFLAIETFPRIFNASYWWPATIQLIRLCNICYKNCFTLPMIPINAYFHSVCLISMSLCYNICVKKRNPVIVLTILYVWRCYRMVRSVTKMIEHISFLYIWFSYTSYIVCISIVNCWSWSIYDDLGSIVCFLTTNFNSKRYKLISLSLYDAVMLRTLHNNWPYVFQACLR